MQGGGLYNYDDASLANVTFAGNYASYQGGAIFDLSGKTVNLSHSKITGNHAPVSEGGGIYNDGGTVSLNNTTVTSNDGSNCAPSASVLGCLG